MFGVKRVRVGFSFSFELWPNHNLGSHDEGRQAPITASCAVKLSRVRESFGRWKMCGFVCGILRTRFEFRRLAITSFEQRM